MRLVTDTCNAHVGTAPQPSRRSVLLRFGTLTLAMTPGEARELADRLHDTADQLEVTE
ncbi:hypothetical protein RCF27_01255 [Rhodococcus pyridinivorans]|uniref:hypothetical protein n=1 Tax=Rhodococcus pyridinivorans TaxID=103816 RepID=UPI00280B13DB|nr:hypothetical protein [Rhodococcus pyridinivorans]WMM73011.1 hypothetical protein RCF27_01255 [Rhodococcus pyridinivorans]